MNNHTLQQVIDLAVKTAVLKAKKGGNSDTVQPPARIANIWKRIS